MLKREDWMMIQEKRTKGVTIKDIAAELGVHPKTVSWRWRAVRRPLPVSRHSFLSTRAK